MNEDKELIDNIFICYDPDAEQYFLEDRSPWAWRSSKDYYETEQLAQNAYYYDKVVWETE